MTTQPGLSFAELFDPAFLERVHGLTLRIAAAQKGGRLADQRTAARGQGSDFADFKPYVAGDDLRAIDWNIYRRLGRAFVRVFEERQDLPVHLLLDVSHSMFVETPPRIHAAARTALALAATALGQQDSVGVLPFAADMSVRLRGVSGKAGIARVAHALADQAPAGGTALAAALARLGGMRMRRGLVVIVSDFFDDGGLEPVIAAMERLPHRLLLVQMVRDYDADPALLPDLDGELLIDDGERAAPASVSITPELIDRYLTAYRAFADRLADFATERGAGLLRIDAGRDVIDQLGPVLGHRGTLL